jgi:poly [ADP-ribose] polymerase 2/3/4
VDGCQVVSLDWLLDSEKAKRRVAEKKYRLGTAKDASLDANTNVGDSEKTSMMSKKRSRLTKGDEENSRPTKKGKDGQKAKQKSLRVDVDECCNLRGGYGLSSLELLAHA